MNIEQTAQQYSWVRSITANLPTMSPPPLIKLALLFVPALVLLNLNVMTTLTTSRAGNLRRRRPANRHAGRRQATAVVDDDEYSASFSRDQDVPEEDDEALSVVRAEMEAAGERGAGTVEDGGDGAPSGEPPRVPHLPPGEPKRGKGRQNRGRIAWLMR